MATPLKRREDFPGKPQKQGSTALILDLAGAHAKKFVDPLSTSLTSDVAQVGLRQEQRGQMDEASIDQAYQNYLSQFGAEQRETGRVAREEGREKRTVEREKTREEGRTEREKIKAGETKEYRQEQLKSQRKPYSEKTADGYIDYEFDEKQGKWIGTPKLEAESDADETNEERLARIKLESQARADITLQAKKDWDAYVKAGKAKKGDKDAAEKYIEQRIRAGEQKRSAISNAAKEIDTMIDTAAESEEPFTAEDIQESIIYKAEQLARTFGLATEMEIDMLVTELEEGIKSSVLGKRAAR